MSIETKPINYESLYRTIGEPSKSLLLYGFTETGWIRVKEALQTDYEGPVEKVYTYSSEAFIFSSSNFGKVQDGIEGRAISRFSIGEKSEEDFKTPLVKLVIENIKREKLGQPLIPLLFLIDLETEIPKPTYFPPPPAEIINNRIIMTLKELRRAYKLLEDPSLPEKIRTIAKRTFCFTQLQITDQLEFKRIPAPWEEEGKAQWDEEWAKYKTDQLNNPLHLPKLEKKRIKLAEGTDWRRHIIETLEYLESQSSRKSRDLDRHFF